MSYGLISFLGLMGSLGPNMALGMIEPSPPPLGLVGPLRSQGFSLNEDWGLMWPLLDPVKVPLSNDTPRSDGTLRSDEACLGLMGHCKLVESPWVLWDSWKRQIA